MASNELNAAKSVYYVIALVVCVLLSWHPLVANFEMQVGKSSALDDRCGWQPLSCRVHSTTECRGLKSPHPLDENSHKKHTPFGEKNSPH